MKRKDDELERLRADVDKKDTAIDNLERMLRLKRCRSPSPDPAYKPPCRSLMPIIPISTQSPHLDPAIAAFFKIGD